MTRPEYPTPPSLTLPPLVGDDAVKAAVVLLDPDSRLGSRNEPPLFMALESGRSRISYLGLTEAGGKWLEAAAGVPFADQCRWSLRRSLLGHDPDAPLPSDGVDQVLVAVARLSVSAPAGPMRLSVTPLGLGPGSGTGLAYSSDPATGEPGIVGSFLAGGTGSHLLDSGGVPIDTLAPEPWLTELSDLLDAAERPSSPG
jgi:pyruvate, orthophosphate dikinase